MKKAYVIAGIAVILTAIMIAFPPQSTGVVRLMSLISWYVLIMS